jgi:hypothetical protein
MTNAQVRSRFGYVTCAFACVPQARVELATFRLGEVSSNWLPQSE